MGESIHFFAVNLILDPSWEKNSIIVLFRLGAYDEEFDRLTCRRGLPKHWMAYHMEGPDDSRMEALKKLPYFIPGKNHPELQDVIPVNALENFQASGFEPVLNIAVRFPGGAEVEVEDLIRKHEPINLNLPATAEINPTAEIEVTNGLD